MDLFNSNFFRFAFGFIGIIGASIAVIGVIALYIGPSHGFSSCIVCSEE